MRQIKALLKAAARTFQLPPKHKQHGQHPKGSGSGKSTLQSRRPAQPPPLVLVCVDLLASVVSFLDAADILRVDGADERRVECAGVLACCLTCARLARCADFWLRLAATSNLSLSISLLAPSPLNGNSDDTEAPAARDLALGYRIVSTGSWVPHLVQHTQQQQQGSAACFEASLRCDGRRVTCTHPQGLAARWSRPVPSKSPSYWEFTVLSHHVGATLRLGLCALRRADDQQRHRQQQKVDSVMMTTAWGFTQNDSQPWLSVGDRVGMAVDPVAGRLAFFYNEVRTGISFRRSDGGEAPPPAHVWEDADVLYPVAVVSSGDSVLLHQRFPAG